MDFRLPNITGATPQEQMAQMQSYMRYFVEQLQWALNNIESVQANGSYNVVSNGGAGRVPSQAPSKPLDALSTFATLKPLIIKSAEIVTAYYETMKKSFNGEYFAESDFGTYIEKTNQTILATSTNVTNAFSNIQEVRSNLNDKIISVEGEVGALDTEMGDFKESVGKDIGDVSSMVGGVEEKVSSFKDDVDKSIEELQGGVAGIDSYLKEVNAHITLGLLTDDDSSTPVYGVEVGQTNIVNGEVVFNKYARFTADRLSFYDENNIEVAYISDRKLYITDIEVLYSIRRGGLMEIILDNGDTVEKWIGRG